MPVVPIQDSITVAPSAPSGERLQTPVQMMRQGTLGADKLMQEGHQIEHAGDQFSAMILSQQINENETNVKQYDASLMSGSHAITTKYTNLAGMDAADPKSKQAALDAVDKMAEQAKNNYLTNPAQVQLAAQHTAMRVTAAKEQIEKHATQQGFVANDAADEMQAKTALELTPTSFNYLTDSATLDPNYDPANVAPGKRSGYQDAIRTAIAATDSRIDRYMGENANPAYRAAMHQQVEAAAYTKTLAYLLRGGTPGEAGGLSSSDLRIATRYLAQVQDKLNPEQLEHAQKLINAGAAGTAALDLSRLVQATFPGDFKAQSDKLGALYDAGEIDQNLFHAASTNVNAQYEVDQRALSTQTAQLIGDLGAKAQTPGATLSNTATAEQKAFLTEHGIWQHAESLFNHDVNKSNPVLYMKLIKMGATDPASLVSLGDGGIALLKGELSAREFDHVQATYLDINKKSVEQQDSLKSAYKAITEVSKQLGAAGIDTSPKEGTQAYTDFAQFQADVAQRIHLAQQQNNGVMLTDEQMRDIALGEAKKQALSGTGLWHWLTSPEKAPYQMTEAERAANGSMTTEDSNRIIASLKAHGMPVTRNNVMEYYNTEQQQKAKK